MDPSRRSFAEEIKFFLNACPGPSVPRRGLYHAAFQRVRGIPDLDQSGPHDELLGDSERRGSSGDGRGEGSYLRKVAEIAECVGCRPAYLTEAALRHGFQYSRALRWIRFLHGMALHAKGVSGLTLAMRLGFSDVAGWSRFTRRLVGRTPSQLPNLPLEYWVRRAVEEVFLFPANLRTEGRKTNR